jgi:hypothetical protein
VKPTHGSLSTDGVRPVVQRKKGRSCGPFRWSCRESNQAHKSTRTAGTPKIATRKHAKRRAATCGYAKGVDGVNTAALLIRMGPAAV